MPRYLTYEEMNMLDRDGKITELVRGVFYNHAAPAIRHQDISRNLEVKICNYLEKNRIGVVYDAPCDVILSDDNVVQPDIFFIKNKNRHRIKEHRIEGAPDLIIEVVSDDGYDIKKKMPLYATYSIPHLWYVFPDENLIKIYRLNRAKYILVQVVSEKDVFTHKLFPGLKIKAKDVFRIH